MKTITILATAIDSSGAWSGLWGKITAVAGVDKLITLGTFIGVGMAAYAIVTWAYSRRKGGATAGKLGWPLVASALLLAPNFIIPSFLWIFDAFANIVVSILA